MRIENTSSTPYGLSAKGFEHVVVPPASKDEKGAVTNGSAEVPAEMLKLVKAEAWGAAVFASGDLVEKAASSKKAAEEEPAKTEPAKGSK